MHTTTSKKKLVIRTLSRNVSFQSHYDKQYGGFLKKLKTELPYDPAIPPPSIYLKKTKTLIEKDTCIPMFTVALFTTAKIQRQPKCPSTHERIKKMWCTYTT